MVADSSVTVSNEKGVKVYNTATTIFKLSDKHPIGVMIYDNVEFMGTPGASSSTYIGMNGEKGMTVDS